ncbi:dicarboxylate/amino acid:cation symporter [Sphingosinicella rhizophila]|uniref:Dicarboxylate/amino acid:cation symporter n=1 Tax=Sphingosinicella rhizophila TaxID=3050082 RepID=A0ABU3Q8U3_9SPHN|nr:dicarboxylate/amino acid:cation symporter [Sphingosinicella sp. GR2756]MDT9599717.1 dicarboxylate/amino acid:cation symporter [Sphingosinicella sp. GR2756]
MNSAQGASPPDGNAVGPLRRYWFGIPLWKRILPALMLGVLTGWLLGENAVQLQWMGDLFIRLIRMLVAPLVFVIIVSGIAALGDPRKLGSIGVKTLFLFALITLSGVTVGLTLGTWIQPGAGISLASAESAAVQQAKSFTEQLLSIVPVNPVKSLAEGEMMSVIFFAIMFGIGILCAGPRAQMVGNLFHGATDVLIKLVHIIMEVAPFGVFALMAALVGKSGFAVFANIFWLALCVVIGCAVQTFLVHGSLVRFLGRLPLLPFYRGIAEVMIVAFSTSSSSATLPVAMAAAEDRLGIKPPVVATVMPLGSTMSMDGTAMYMALLSMFAAQSFGIVLQPSDYLLLLLSITIVAMGTPPIPSSSLFLLVAILSGVGIGPEQTALLVGFILPIDRPLDMIRTIPNVTSDLAAATVVAKWEGEIDLDIYHARRPNED